MSTLNNLKLSISELTRDEAFKLILAIRANRRVQKKNFFKQEKTNLKSQNILVAKSKQMIMALDETEKTLLRELLLKGL